MTVSLAAPPGAIGASVSDATPQIVIDRVLEGPGQTPLALDAARQRLYLMSRVRGELIEYDLDPRHEVLARRARLPMDGWLRLGNNNAFDPVNQRLFIIDRPGTTDQQSCHRQPPPCATIRTVDLATLQLAEESQWDLPRLVPGFTPFGMTYAAMDHRLYVIGSFQSALNELTVPNKPMALPVGVVAIDVDAVGSDAVAWVRPIKTCTLPLIDVTVGAGIYRSQRYPALYFGCSRADLATVGQQLPGHVGVVRLWIDPSLRHATLAESSLSNDLREEFFRASGSFGDSSGITGRTGFDPATERFVMVSNSTNTKGTWVFDGVLSAWAGFVLSAGNNTALGLDLSSGTMIVKDGDRFRVADLRATPATQGLTYSIPDGVWPTDAHFDAFGRMYWAGALGKIMVAKVPSLPRRFSTVTDYDSITHDIDEGPTTSVTFAGSSTGFGARVTMVGGSGGATAPVRPATFSRGIENRVGTTPGLASGDRGFSLGHLSRLDLRDTGAEAGAQAVALDDVTSNDDRTVRGLDLQQEAARNARFVAEAMDQDPDGGSGVLEAVDAVPEQGRRPLAATSWPWAPAFCIQGVGEPTPDPDAQRTGSSSTIVRCDLGAGQAEASSGAAAVAADGVTIGEGAITSISRRLPGRISVESHASASGIEVAINGVGSLRIGKVALDVLTTAGGRPGTARVWESRRIEGVEVRDPQGQVMYACGATCDVHVVAAMINENLGGDMRMIVPEPEIITTPRGAYAGFRESYDRYISDLVMNNDASQAMPALQLEIYHDFSDKSRTIVQFAAVDSSSLYGISANPAVARDPKLLPKDPPPDPGIGGGPEPQGNPGSSFAQDPSDGLVTTLVRQALFLVRSPGQAVSMFLTLSLLVGFVVLSSRRRALGAIL